MNKEFSVLSENTIQYITFHDCLCSKLNYTENTLVFEMEWMEVLSEHPDNPYSQAHQSGVGKVLLQAPKLIKCELYRTPEEKVEIYSLDEIAFCDLWFYDFCELKDKDGYSAKIFFVFENVSEYDVGTIDVEYEKSYVMWNELKDLSWFEDDKRTS